MNIKSMIEKLNQQQVLGVGLGMAGSGAIFVVISWLVANGYWFLVTGTVFVVIGLVMLAGWTVAQKV